MRNQVKISQRGDSMKVLIILLSFLLAFSCLAEEFKNVEVSFSPKGVDTEAIVKEINSAKSEILLQAQWLTSKTIADALVSAHKRGVKIEAVTDHSKHKENSFLSDLKIPTYIDSLHVPTHNKVMIIDRKTLITSSSKSTKPCGKNNSGNLLILKGNNPQVDKYIMIFEEHKAHSELYQGK